MKYKIVFIDLDGTLLNSNSLVSKFNRKVLNKLNEIGVIVVLATGRSSNSALNYAKELNIGPYIISSNGAEAYDYINDKLIYVDNLDKSIVLDIYRYCKEQSLLMLINTKFRRYASMGGSHNYDVINEDKLMKIDVCQFSIRSRNYNKIISLMELYKVKYPEINCVTPWSIDYSNMVVNNNYQINYINVGVSKGCAINELLEYLNIPSDSAIGIGDALNDIPMIDSVGLFVAMENGKNEIKRRADIVTKSNDLDGVGISLSEIFKIEVNDESY